MGPLATFGAVTRAIWIGLLVCGLALPGSAAPSVQPTLAQLVGQKLVVSMSGSAPPASLPARAGRGGIGGAGRVNFQFPPPPPPGPAPPAPPPRPPPPRRPP